MSRNQWVLEIAAAAWFFGALCAGAAGAEETNQERMQREAREYFMGGGKDNRPRTPDGAIDWDEIQRRADGQEALVEVKKLRAENETLKVRLAAAEKELTVYRAREAAGGTVKAGPVLALVEEDAAWWRLWSEFLKQPVLRSALAPALPDEQVPAWLWRNECFAKRRIEWGFKWGEAEVRSERPDPAKALLWYGQAVHDTADAKESLQKAEAGTYAGPIELAQMRGRLKFLEARQAMMNRLMTVDGPALLTIRVRGAPRDRSGQSEAIIQALVPEALVADAKRKTAEADRAEIVANLRAAGLFGEAARRAKEPPPKVSEKGWRLGGTISVIDWPGESPQDKAPLNVLLDDPTLIPD